VFAVAQHHLTVDDAGQKTVGFLLQASRPGRQIVGDLGEPGADRCGIKNHHIGLPALPQQAASGQTPLRGRHEAQLVHGLFQAQRLFVADPVAQHVGLERGVHDLRHVSPGVREGDDRAGMAHHLQHVVLVVIDQRLQEKALQMFFQSQIEKSLKRVLAAFVGNLGHRAVGRGCRVHDKQPLEIRRPSFSPDTLIAPLRRLTNGGDQSAAQLRVAQSGFLLGQRQFAEIGPHRQLVKRRGRLKRQDHTQGPAVDLNEHPSAGCRRVIGQPEEGLPHIGRLPAAEHAEGNRHAGIDGQGLEPSHVLINPVGVEPGVLIGDLEHPGVLLTQYADELTHLVPVRQAAGHRLVVGRLMIFGP